MKHVVIDFEMNRIKAIPMPEGRALNQEIVEIGAVMLDEQLNQVDTFSCYVKPQYNKLTTNCKKLTGITERNVEEAQSLKEVLDVFKEWLRQEEVKIYSWSENDLNQLTYECEVKEVRVLEELMHNWVDLQDIFNEKLGMERRISLKNALGALDIPFNGQQHRALDDSINTSYILRLMNDEAELEKRLHPIKAILGEEEEGFSCTIGSLIGEQLCTKIRGDNPLEES